MYVHTHVMYIIAKSPMTLKNNIIVEEAHLFKQLLGSKDSGGEMRP